MYPPIKDHALLIPSQYKIFEDDCPAGWFTNGPTGVIYEAGKETRCAKQFLDAFLPRRLISRQGVFYSLTVQGFYTRIIDDRLKRAIRESDHASLLSGPKISGMLGAMHELCGVDTDPGHYLFESDGDPDPMHLMLFNNGYFDPIGNTFHTYDGRFFAVDPPNFPYDPYAQCPKWHWFLNQALESDDQAVLHEFFGYCMTRNTSHHKFLVLLGATRAGKSTTAAIGEKLVGSINTGHRIFRDIPKDTSFRGLEGKSLLVIADAHNIEDRHKDAALNVIKAQSGGDEISYRILYKGTTSAKFGMRVIMVANFHPALVDSSGALLSRELILDFKSSALGREDRTLSSQLEKELSGIANLCIKGYRRLLSEGDFTPSLDSIDAYRHVERLQMPIKAFIKENLIVSKRDSDFVSDGELREKLDLFCSENGVRHVLRSVNHAKDLIIHHANDPLVRRSQRIGKSWETGKVIARHGLVGVQLK